MTNALAFMVPVGFSVAVSTRCANELGAEAGAREVCIQGGVFAILAVEFIVSRCSWR